MINQVSLDKLWDVRAGTFFSLFSLLLNISNTIINADILYFPPKNPSGINMHIPERNMETPVDRKNAHPLTNAFYISIQCQGTEMNPWCLESLSVTPLK